jgi:hypothetical protein
MLAFAKGRMLRLAVAPFQRTGDMDMASGVIELSLSE